MSLCERTYRIASLTSIIRTRKEDGVRMLVNGGTNTELRLRQEAVVARLERLATRLEDALK